MQEILKEIEQGNAKILSVIFTKNRARLPNGKNNDTSNIFRQAWNIRRK